MQFSAEWRHLKPQAQQPGKCACNKPAHLPRMTHAIFRYAISFEPATDAISKAFFKAPPATAHAKCPPAPFSCHK